MFAPTKQWRRWHRKVGVAQKRCVVTANPILWLLMMIYHFWSVFLTSDVKSRLINPMK